MRKILVVDAIANAGLSALLFLSFCLGSPYAPPFVFFVRLAGGVLTGVTAVLCIFLSVYVHKIPKKVAVFLVVVGSLWTAGLVVLFVLLRLEGTIRY
ncbi:MAG: hypothetical protein NTW87_20080 [Planctomycetota bacterium]|nr:hypothetical protein [Planctomycetota bacterium]